MKKRLVILIIIILLLVVWYFFAPIKWTFGLRTPKNFNECQELGGELAPVQRDYILSQGIGLPTCIYKGQKYPQYFEM